MFKRLGTGHILHDMLIYNTLYDGIARDKLEARDILGILSAFLSLRNKRKL